MGKTLLYCGVNFKSKKNGSGEKNKTPLPNSKTTVPKVESEVNTFDGRKGYT